MTNEELALLIKNGDASLMTQLWEQVQKFIAMKARWYVNQAEKVWGNARGCTVEDLIQEGYFALLSAVNYFDPSLGFAFITMLSMRLRSAFAEAFGLRTASGRNNALDRSDSLDRPVNDAEDSTLGDLVTDERTEGPGSVEELIVSSLYNQQLYDALKKSISFLPDRQKDIILERYYDEKTLSEIGEQMGCTRSNVGQLEQSALQKMYDQRDQSGLSSYLEKRTNYYQSVGVARFQNTWTSSVELIALQRERYIENWLKNKYKLEEKS